MYAKTNPGLDDCLETSCDPSYPEFCISPNQRGLNCDHGGIIEPNEVPNHNFKSK